MANVAFTTFVYFFFQTNLFTETFSRTTTIHPDIFGGRVLWVGNVSPRMNTIASRHQFEPKRIGGNLVVNYKGL